MPEQLIARRDPNITGSLLFQALLVFVLALVARLLFLAGRGPDLSPDTSEYLTLAHNLPVHLPLWIEYRFWVPVVPFLVATAAVGGDQLLTRIKARAQH